MKLLITIRTTIRLFLILVPLCYFTILPIALAVVPAPDGGYPGGNTAEGQNALLNLTTGLYNTAVGLNALYSDTTGGRNTATGVNALRLNLIGNHNTAVGTNALYSNSADENTAVGDGALSSNTSGSNNTAIGDQALNRNSTGLQNTAAGSVALYQNTSGYYNTATGFLALYSNTTGYENTATGNQALLSNAGGFQNCAFGFNALESNNGFESTAVGYAALARDTTGNFNTALGAQSLQNITTGYDNVAIGFAAGNTLTANDNNNIDILNAGVAGDSRVTRIGAVQLKTFIAGIFGATISNGTPVYINSDGQLGAHTSSARFKHEIRAMGTASEAVLALKPVTFRYRKDIDPQNTPQFGLVAEEVEKVSPDLVVHDGEGKPYSVRYEQVNAMLLNEFLKEHREVLAQHATIAQLKNDLKEQRKRIEALSRGLQRVNGQCELVRAAPHTVAENW